MLTPRWSDRRSAFVYHGSWRFWSIHWCIGAILGIFDTWRRNVHKVKTIQLPFNCLWKGAEVWLRKSCTYQIVNPTRWFSGLTFPFEPIVVLVLNQRSLCQPVHPFTFCKVVGTITVRDAKKTDELSDADWFMFSHTPSLCLDQQYRHRTEVWASNPFFLVMLWLYLLYWHYSLLICRMNGEIPVFSIYWSPAKSGILAKSPESTFFWKLKKEL